jgi:primary-amine oxidase
MRTASLFAVLAVSMWGQSPDHPLDGLSTAEYWIIRDTLKSAGHAPTGTVFASVLLRPPEKAGVLTWETGQPIHREADVLLLRGEKTYAAIVDITAARVIRMEQLVGAHAPILASEMLGPDSAIRGDIRVIQSLRKRGITDLSAVECVTFPLPYRAIAGQDTQRIGVAQCSETSGGYHSWGRSIEGLIIHVDMVTRKVLRVVDTDVIPVAPRGLSYEEAPEITRPNSTLIETVQPLGSGFKISKGEIAWQDWLFRFRLDHRVGIVLNLVRYVDKGRARSVLYEASLSELFVPYMDTANGWNHRVYLDSGGFYATGGVLKPLRPGIDCPVRASWFDALSAAESGAPRIRSNMACLFERNPDGPAWRHSEQYGRPARELILRSALVMGNYDYILDWRFEPDGTIEVAAGATGVIETKAAVERAASSHDAHSTAHSGQFVADHIIGVNQTGRTTILSSTA